jgi:quercetin dioxygenase-like cupin family protein
MRILLAGKLLSDVAQAAEALLLFENAEVRIARRTFPPGVGHERHLHSAHLGYTLEGAAMRVTTA